MERGMKILAFLFVVATVYLASVEGSHGTCNQKTGLMQTTCPRTLIRYYLYRYSCGWWGSCYTWRYYYYVTYYPCEKACKVDGGWTAWGEKYKSQPCSKTCGGGVEEYKQERSCTNPIPRNGGKPCEGEAVMKTYKDCNTFRCPADICREVVRGYTAYPDPNETKLFLQCEHKEAYTMECDKNLIWKQDIKSCDWPKKECKNGNYHSHVSDPTKFMQCDQGLSIVMSCGNGTIWNQDVKTCVHEKEESEEDEGEVCTGNEQIGVEGNDKQYKRCVHKRWVTMTCAHGTVWRQERGRCDY